MKKVVEFLQADSIVDGVRKSVRSRLFAMCAEKVPVELLQKRKGARHGAE